MSAVTMSVERAISSLAACQGFRREREPIESTAAPRGIYQSALKFFRRQLRLILCQ